MNPHDFAGKLGRLAPVDQNVIALPSQSSSSLAKLFGSYQYALFSEASFEFFPKSSPTSRQEGREAGTDVATTPLPAASNLAASMENLSSSSRAFFSENSFISAWWRYCWFLLLCLGPSFMFLMNCGDSVLGTTAVSTFHPPVPGQSKSASIRENSLPHAFILIQFYIF